MRDRSYWILVSVYVVVLISAQSFLGYGIDFFKETWGEVALNRTAYVLVALGGLTMVILGARLWRLTTFRDRCLIALSLALYGVGTMSARFPQERLHYVGYGVLASLLYAGWKNPARISPREPEQHPEWARPAALTLVVGGAIGFLDELLQILWPRRYFDWEDVRINILAVAVGILGNRSFQTVDGLAVPSVKEQRQAVERLDQIPRTVGQFQSFDRILCLLVVSAEGRIQRPVGQFFPQPRQRELKLLLCLSRNLGLPNRLVLRLLGFFPCDHGYVPLLVHEYCHPRAGHSSSDQYPRHDCRCNQDPTMT